MGRVVDTETGLIYLRARYYDPTTAQFITRDPLVAVTGSAYGYAGDNPLSGADPSGLDYCIHNPFGGDNCQSLWKQHPAIQKPLIAAVAVPLVAAGVACVLATGGICAGVTPGIAAAVAGTGGTVTAAQLSSDASMIGETSGPATVIPAGATGPYPADNGAGVQFTGGCGGQGLDPRVSGVRVMDPTSLYPNGYVNYFNPQGQSVDPATGQTIARSNPLWHIPR